MHRNPTPHTWMHRNHRSSGECTEILPLTHENTEIMIPQVNAPESYPSHMNALKSSFLRWMHRHPSPHTWMHRNHHPSSKCTRILPLTHECTEIVTPQGHRNPTPHTWIHQNHHLPSKCTGILPLTHECTEIIIPQVSAPKYHSSHMNAPKSSLLK